MLHPEALLKISLLFDRQARQELKALKESEAMFGEQYSDTANGTTEGLL